MSENLDYLSCQAVCHAESFDFQNLSQALLSAGRCACYRDVIYLEVEQGSCAIFPFGVAVYWNVRTDVIERIDQQLQQFSLRPYEERETEHFAYLLDCERNRFTHEHIELTDNDAMTLLAFSHALAQSVKLAVFEKQAQQTIEETSSIPRKLAETGSTHLSRRQTAKMRGRLFLTKSDIILKYELLDTPEFFWEYPELEPVYQIGANYLELKQRTEVLSLKLETIHELFQMLADDQKHQHSSTLEWIIIWLIAVEILIFFVNDVLLPHL
jgi:uncharacterized Rmd1/YagE family protein